MPEEFAVTERRLADGRCSKRVAVRVWKRLSAMIQMALQRTLGQAARSPDAGSRAFRGVACLVGSCHVRLAGLGSEPVGFDAVGHLDNPMTRVG